jgi:hypothetical protein
MAPSARRGKGVDDDRIFSRERLVKPARAR